MMMRRVHEYLDGELAWDALTPQEQQQALELRASTANVVDALRSTPVPDLSASIMMRVRNLAPVELPVRKSRLALLLDWFWQPRSISISVRPAFGALMACLFLLLMVPANREGDLPVPAETLENRQVWVQFRLEAPQAQRVEIAGTFTNWEPAVSLHETSPGVWSAMVPMQGGVHDYNFLIDGAQWVPDPQALQVEDEFGGHNSRISVPL